jgi:hypothetical protein
VLKAQEERKAMLAAANAKKKAGGKGGKKGKDDAAEEEVKEETKPEKEEDRELDLNNPADFAIALQRKCPRPFTFGPLEFMELDKTPEEKVFKDEEERAFIIKQLEDTLGEPLICMHGYNVKIKGRTFMRRTTMLKHGRFL